jgi:hypothetical protein
LPLQRNRYALYYSCSAVGRSRPNQGKETVVPQADSSWVRNGNEFGGVAVW